MCIRVGSVEVRRETVESCERKVVHKEGRKSENREERWKRGKKRVEEGKERRGSGNSIISTPNQRIFCFIPEESIEVGVRE